MTHTRFLLICVFNRKHNCFSCPFIDFGLKTQSRSLLFKETHALLIVSSLPWGNTFWTHSRFPSTLLAWLGNTTAFIGYFLFKRGNTYECQGKHIFLEETQASFLSSAPLLFSIAVSISSLYSKVHATVYLYCLPAVSITVLFVAR